MDNIINQIINNFDFAYMLVVNVLTYMVIKLVDCFNGEMQVTTWQKRLILVLSILIITAIYLIIGYENKAVLINSAVVSPVAWSWVLKPAIDKLGIGYKKV